MKEHDYGKLKLKCLMTKRNLKYKLCILLNLNLLIEGAFRFCFIVLFLLQYFFIYLNQIMYYSCFNTWFNLNHIINPHLIYTKQLNKQQEISIKRFILRL